MYKRFSLRIHLIFSDPITKSDSLNKEEEREEGEEGTSSVSNLSLNLNFYKSIYPFRGSNTIGQSGESSRVDSY